MLGPLTNHDKALIIVAVASFLVMIGNWAYSFSTVEFVSFITTIVATFSGVGLAAYLNVRQFYYEGRKRDEAQSQQLGQSLAGELYTVLDILRGPPNVTILDPNSGSNHISVVFTQLTPVASDEGIRVGLFGAQSAANLSQVSNLMREYTKASNDLYSLVSEWRRSPRDLELWNTAYQRARELNRLKTNLIIWCDAVLPGLASQGIEMPEDPQYRSNSTRVQHYRMD